MGTHDNKNIGATNAALTYGAAALGGVLAAAMVLMFTEIATFGALAIGFVLFCLAAWVLHKGMLTPLPAPGSLGTPAAPMPQAAPPAPAPVPTTEGKPEHGTQAAGEAAAVASDAPAVKPTAPLPGQQDLATRKGEWTYTSGDASTGVRPAGLPGPRDGSADDLKQIKGVGPKLEEMLHGMGYYHFDQIANWTEAEVAWVDENLEGFKGRVSRDEWVSQARELSKS